MDLLIFKQHYVQLIHVNIIHILIIKHMEIIQEDLIEYLLNVKHKKQ
jgi:hypothetical protein